jgi:hypothetical protein
MQVTARFHKRLDILVMVFSVINIISSVSYYRKSGDLNKLVAAVGWLVAVGYEYLVITKYPYENVHI